MAVAMDPHVVEHVAGPVLSGMVLIFYAGHARRDIHEALAKFIESWHKALIKKEFIRAVAHLAVLSYGFSIAVAPALREFFQILAGSVTA